MGNAHVVRARRGERAVAALERTVRIVEEYWTPLAARHGAMLVSHLTPRDAEEVLATLGHMQPSKSSLDRLAAQGAVGALGGAAGGLRGTSAARPPLRSRTRPVRWWSRSTE